MSATAAAATSSDLADLSLEELARIEVTSVSRRPEQLSHAAASIYIITGEAIRHSGASSLPEALRLAPNLQVARLDSNSYAITARGFNNAIGNKLLVLIDGRTVYASFFSGVLWDQQDVMLEDVERIEVISGPGATLWGANAVNGVINVITKAAADTPGGLVSVRGGNRENGASLRYGTAIGDSGHLRVYAKSTRQENSRTASGQSVADGSTRDQLGFRSEWLGAGGKVTLQGDAYQGKTDDRGFFGPFALGPLKVSGSNLVARWTRQFSNGSDLQVQAFYDHMKREDALLYRPEAEVSDIEFQHGLLLGAANKLLWGGGYRRAHDDIRPGVFFGFVPASRTLVSKNLFVQGEFKLHPTLELTLGLKLERNGYTGTEKLPSARLGWALAENRLLWASASRAVRAPARLDRDIRLPPAPNPNYTIAGGPNFVSEVANVYELGYRAQQTPTWNYAITAFRHEWDRLRSGQPPPNAQVQNMIEGLTYGIEAWTAWQAAAIWRLSAGLTLLKESLHLKPGSTDPVGPSNLGNDPKQQWSLHSTFTLPREQELDLGLRRVAALPQPAVPAYTALDLRYGWRVRPRLELSLIGQNLLDRSHAEFGAAPGRSEIGRSIFLQLRWSP